MKDSAKFLSDLMRHVLRHRLVPEGFRLEYKLDPSRLNEDDENTDHHLVVTNGEVHARVQLSDEKVCIFIELGDNTEMNDSRYFDDMQPNCLYVGNQKQATRVFETCLRSLPYLHERMMTMVKSYKDVRNRFSLLFGGDSPEDD